MATTYVFHTEEDAERFARAIDGVRRVDNCVYPTITEQPVCRQADTDRLIEAELEEDEPEFDGPSCERCGFYPAATCECDEVPSKL